MKIALKNIRPFVFRLYGIFNNDYKIFLLFLFIAAVSFLQMYIDKKINFFYLKVLFSMLFTELAIAMASTFYFGITALSFFYSKTGQRSSIDFWLMYFILLNILHGVPALCFYLCFNLLNKQKIETQQ
jgi:hypothetical protein